MAPRQDRGGGKDARRSAFRVESAAIFDALALSARRDFSSFRRARHRPDRLVAARPGRADRQIQAGCTAAGGVEGRSCVNGRDAAEPMAAGSCVVGRATSEAYRRKRNRLEFIPVRASLGVAQPRGILGDHGCKPCRTSDGECRGGGLRGGARSIRAGRGNPDTVPAPPVGGLFASSKACSRTNPSSLMREMILRPSRKTICISRGPDRNRGPVALSLSPGFARSFSATPSAAFMVKRRLRRSGELCNHSCIKGPLHSYFLRSTPSLVSPLKNLKITTWLLYFLDKQAEYDRRGQTAYHVVHFPH